MMTQLTVPILTLKPVLVAVRQSPQNLSKQFPRHRDLGHLERHVAATAHHPHADLEEFLPQAGQRLRLRRLGESQRPHEILEIVGERMKLKADGVGSEGVSL